jgi:hypothetical protein
MASEAWWKACEMAGRLAGVRGSLGGFLWFPVVFGLSCAVFAHHHGLGNAARVRIAAIAGA